MALLNHLTIGSTLWDISNSTIGSITFPNTGYTEESSGVFTITGTNALITDSSIKVDLQPSISVIQQMQLDGISQVYIETTGTSSYKAYCIGNYPSTAMTAQATFTPMVIPS